jgi:hypothetical protein
MNRIHPHTFGIAFAGFLALWHVLWAFLVWIGAAQWLIDFIFRLHMITPPYKVTAFSFGVAAALVLVTASIGYVSGFVIGTIWNRCVPRAKSS